MYVKFQLWGHVLYISNLKQARKLKGMCVTVAAKLVCALLLEYCYGTIGYDVICLIVGSLY